MKVRETTNIDEAAWLLTQGCNVEVFSVSERSAVFFVSGHRIDDLIDMFRMRHVRTDLHSFMYHRNALKIRTATAFHHHATNSLVRESRDATVKDYRSLIGTPYWYLGEKNEVLHAIYGLGSPVHYDRYMSGNFYPTKGDALNAAALKS